MLPPTIVEEELPFGLTYYDPYFAEDDQAIIASWDLDSQYTWFDLIQHVITKLYPRLQITNKLSWEQCVVTARLFAQFCTPSALRKAFNADNYFTLFNRYVCLNLLLIFNLINSLSVGKKPLFQPVAGKKNAWTCTKWFIERYKTSEVWFSIT
jgi:hypothetical protein